MFVTFVKTAITGLGTGLVEAEVYKALTKKAKQMGYNDFQAHATATAAIVAAGALTTAVTKSPGPVLGTFPIAGGGLSDMKEDLNLDFTKMLNDYAQKLKYGDIESVQENYRDLITDLEKERGLLISQDRYVEAGILDSYGDFLKGRYEDTIRKYGDGTSMDAGSGEQNPNNPADPNNPSGDPNTPGGTGGTGGTGNTGGTGGTNPGSTPGNNSDGTGKKSPLNPFGGGGDWGDAGAGGRFGKAGSAKWDPLVLDLDGDGIENISLAASTAYFDLDNSVFAEKIGWVKSDDGVLVLDRNNDGIYSHYLKLRKQAKNHSKKGNLYLNGSFI